MRKLPIFTKAKFLATRWAVEEKATALIESALLFPVLLSLLLASYDLGRGIVVNQKTIAAAQIIGDLITRDRSVTMSSLEDIVVAGELALAPYATGPFGYDIASVQFDSDGDPVVLWRVTKNTTQNNTAVDSTEGLGEAGDGLIVVTANYRYQPYFAGFIVDEINMREVAFLHGRKSSTVACADCPT